MKHLMALLMMLGVFAISFALTLATPAEVTSVAITGIILLVLAGITSRFVKE